MSDWVRDGKVWVQFGVVFVIFGIAKVLKRAGRTVVKDFTLIWKSCGVLNIIGVAAARVNARDAKRVNILGFFV